MINLIEAAVQVSAKYEIDSEAEYERFHPSRRKDDAPEIAYVLQFHEFYKKELHAVLDTLIAEFFRQLQSWYGTYKASYDSLPTS